MQSKEQQHTTHTKNLFSNFGFNFSNGKILLFPKSLNGCRQRQVIHLDKKIVHLDSWYSNAEYLYWIILELWILVIARDSSCVSGSFRILFAKYSTPNMRNVLISPFLIVWKIFNIRTKWYLLWQEIIESCCMFTFLKCYT